MSSFTCTISGISDVRAKLTESYTKLRAEVGTIVQQTGMNTRDDAREAAPINKDLDAPTRGQLKAGMFYRQIDDVSCEAGNDVYYGPYVENGHHTRSGSFVPAQPFLFPSFEKNRVWMGDQLEALRM